MMHIKEEKISAYLDGQLGADDALAVEAHLQDCGPCRNLFDELSEVSDLFRKAERFEPSPFLWNRIEADFRSKKSSAHTWKDLFIAGLGKHSWNLRLASATLVVLMLAGIVVFRGNEDRRSDRAALANIDQTYKSLAALDPDTYNPFGSGLSQEFETNPFKNLRASSEKSGIHEKSRSVE
jgi:predicted anti-sigma-YlaC factor YlaD